MAKTIILLAAHPSLTGAELAQKLKVSSSYARTLLRRARSLPTEPQAEQGAEITTMLQDLRQRLTSAEEDLAVVRAMPVHARASLNLNRRAEVLRLLESGLETPSVAERLGIPEGEVEFIHKVDRLLASSV
jgi:DNA-directed RNA polymerase specialized sigma24 family protein